MQITNVQISGVDEHRVERLHASVMESIQGKYLGLFSRDNIIIFPRRTLQNMIQDTFAEVDTVRVHREGIHTIAVAAKERELAAVICAKFPDFTGKELSLDDPGACYFADVNGFIFKKAPSFSGDIYNRYYIPDLIELAAASSTDTIVGQFATSTEEFTLMQELYDGIKKHEITVDAILMKSGGEYELYARNPLTTKTSASDRSSTVVIYFNSASSPDVQIANLVSFWSHMTNAARAKNEPLEFEYIDARYGDNVFYRVTK